MPLKTIVKVGNLTNLSDARYCAGMNADMLGFVTVEGQENYLPVEEYETIRGWVSGPKVVAEVYGIKNQEQLDKIIEAYKPDYLEMDEHELGLVTAQLPILLRVSEQSSNELPASVAFIIKTYREGMKVQDTLRLHQNVLLETNTLKSIQHLIEDNSVKGIVLSGSRELSPGLKDYEHLAEILENLQGE
jgi:phosphoribosylanthranilate isomerase